MINFIREMKDNGSYKIFFISDSAATIDFGNVIDEQINTNVITLFNYLLQHRLDGMIEAIPAYSSLSVYFDFNLLRKRIPQQKKVYEWIENELHKLMRFDFTGHEAEKNLVRIPVCYEGEFAIDLHSIAMQKNISIQEIIHLHSSRKYRVYMLGFLPGFAYMGEVEERIAVRRKIEPQPILAGSVGIAGKQFQKWKKGARCYLAIKEKLNIQKWLNSYSTNIKAGSGGFNGRALQKDDVISFKEKKEYKKILKNNDLVILPWKADIVWSKKPIERIVVFFGNEWNKLTEESKNKFLNEPFVIGSLADRMGYHLQGTLRAKEDGELVSSAVSFGTIQLLPNGELIVLMADHQTTGGYPRIAYVVSAHLPFLAQSQPGDKIYFRLTDQEHAEDLLLLQQQHLLQLQNACKFRLEEFFNTANVNN